MRVEQSNGEKQLLPAVWRGDKKTPEDLQYGPLCRILPRHFQIPCSQDNKDGLQGEILYVGGAESQLEQVACSRARYEICMVKSQCGYRG